MRAFFFSLTLIFSHRLSFCRQHQPTRTKQEQHLLALILFFWRQQQGRNRSLSFASPSISPSSSPSTRIPTSSSSHDEPIHYVQAFTMRFHHDPLHLPSPEMLQTPPNRIRTDLSIQLTRYFSSSITEPKQLSSSILLVALEFASSSSTLVLFLFFFSCSSDSFSIPLFSLLQKLQF